MSTVTYSAVQPVNRPTITAFTGPAFATLGTAKTSPTGISLSVTFPKVNAMIPPVTLSPLETLSVASASTVNTAFVLGTVRDLDGDGTADGIAVVRRFDDPTDAGAVVFFKNGGAPQIL